MLERAEYNRGLWLKVTPIAWMFSLVLTDRMSMSLAFRDYTYYFTPPQKILMLFYLMYIYMYGLMVYSYSFYIYAIYCMFCMLVDYHGCNMVVSCEGGWRLKIKNWELRLSRGQRASSQAKLNEKFMNSVRSSLCPLNVFDFVFSCIGLKCWVHDDDDDYTMDSGQFLF